MKAKGSGKSGFLSFLFQMLFSGNDKFRVFKIITYIIILSFIVSGVIQMFPEGLEKGIKEHKINPIPLLDATAGSFLNADKFVYDSIMFLKNNAYTKWEYIRTLLVIIGAVWVEVWWFKVIKNKIVTWWVDEHAPKWVGYSLAVLIFLCLGVFYDCIYLIFALIFSKIQFQVDQGFYSIMWEVIKTLTPFKGLVCMFVYFKIWLVPITNIFSNQFANQIEPSTLLNETIGKIL